MSLSSEVEEEQLRHQAMRLTTDPDESHCIRWALTEVPDPELVLEAAWQVPFLLKHSSVRDFSLDYVAVNKLFFHFLECITKDPQRPQSSDIVTYSAAVCHLMLSWRHKSFPRRGLDAVRSGLSQAEGLTQWTKLFSGILMKNFSLWPDDRVPLMTSAPTSNPETTSGPLDDELPLDDPVFLRELETV